MRVWGRIARALPCAAAALAAGLAGQPADAGGEADPLAALAGAEWRLVAIDGAPAPAAPAPITLRYDGGRIDGFAGCNRYFASIEAAGGGAVTVGPAGATRMACPEPQMALESRFLGMLSAAVELRTGGDELVLRGSGGELAFSRAAP